MLTRTLQLAFVTPEGKKATISIKEPKPSLTEMEVKQVIQTIINQQVFEINNEFYSAAQSAKLVERYVTSYEL